MYVCTVCMMYVCMMYVCMYVCTDAQYDVCTVQYSTSTVLLCIIMYVCITGGSNKKGTRTENVLKNTVYIELYDVDVHD